MLSHRKGVLLDGIGAELVRSANGGRRKTLSAWLKDLQDATELGDLAETFTGGDASPDVSGGSNWITSGSTTITDFDGATEGQILTVMRGDADITITRNASLIETLDATSITLTATHPMVRFRSVSGVWQEIERSDSVILPSGGATHTLANWLAGLGRGDDAPAYVGFWPDVTSATRVWTFRDRVAIGLLNGTDLDFNTPGGDVLATADGASWLLRDSDLVVFSSIGRQAIAGISRVSDQIQSPAGSYGAAIGVSGALINNVAGRTGWASYFDVQHESGAGASFGTEYAIKNKGADATYSPYAANAGTFGIWLAGGGDASYGGAPTAPSMVAIAIGANATTWNSGIVFKDGALTDVSGISNAMVMPQNYSIRWDRPNGTTAGRIYSSMSNTSSGTSYRLIYADNGFQIAGTAAINIAEFQHTASAVNGFRFTNNVTGQAAIISATGTDTNIDVEVAPKGDALMFVNRADTGTNSVSTALRLRHAITGTPSAGCGVALEFQQETTDNNFEIGAKIEVVTTDITSTSEDFDFVVKLMAAGAAATEVARFTSDKKFKLPTASVIDFASGDVTVTHASNALAFGGASSGYSFDALITPAANDGAALGSTTLMWSDAFLAAGAVINFNNGDVTVTHSTDTLTFGGATSGYFFNGGAMTVGGALNAANAQAIPAGGAQTIALKCTSTAQFGVFFGSGVPTVSAAKGSLYLRSDGSTTNDRAYINTNGTTTWTALTTAA